MIDVSVIGTGGMMPLSGRHLAAMAVRMGGRMLLIDCGEGAQVTLRQTGWGFKHIDCICITHVHGDHISGLPGMLLAVANSGRQEPMIIAGPAGVARVAESLRVIAPNLPYDISYIEFPAGGADALPFECGAFSMAALPLDHTVPCVGYSLRLRRPGRFDPDKARRNGVPMQLWSALQREGLENAGGCAPPDPALGPLAPDPNSDACASGYGEEYKLTEPGRAASAAGGFQRARSRCRGEAAGRSIPLAGGLGDSVPQRHPMFTPDMVLGPERKGIKLCYITDTRPTAALPGFVAGADLLVCEGLHGGDDMRDKAAAHKHMVFSEAAALARAGGVRALWLTHFSPAMTEPEKFLPVAATIFEHTRVCYDRMTATLTFEDE